MWRSAVVALLVVGVACAGDDDDRAADADTPPVLAQDIAYDERLALARDVARAFPGVTVEGAPMEEFGVWAGILAQTEWQQRSGRDQVANWSLVNLGLTVEAAWYADEWSSSSGPESERCAASAVVAANPTPVGQAVGRADVCEAWMRYFTAARSDARAEDVQSTFWVAHTTAILERLHEFGYDLGWATTPEERNFWGNWIEVVSLLEAGDVATTGDVAVPASDMLMPRCAPLGSPGCAVSEGDLGAQYEFVAPLAGRDVEVADIIDFHGQVSRMPSVGRGLTGPLADMAGMLDLDAVVGDPAAVGLLDAVRAYAAAAGP